MVFIHSKSIFKSRNRLAEVLLKRKTSFETRKTLECFFLKSSACDKSKQKQTKHVVIVNRINRGAWLDIGPDLAEYVSTYAVLLKFSKCARERC